MGIRNVFAPSLCHPDKLTVKSIGFGERSRFALNMEGTMQLASSGGRRLRHAALAARKLALEAGRTVTRKELSAAARDAGKALDLRPAQRAVLSELVACWGEQEWERLLVWPSNDYLMSRTGLTERAIRRILRQLVDLQLHRARRTRPTASAMPSRTWPGRWSTPSASI